MPNYCNNHLILEHKNPKMIAQAHAALERGELLQEFIPVPAALKATMAGSYGDPDKQKVLEQQEADNLAKYGYKNWYDFCVNEWGTKWDVGEHGCSEVHPISNVLHAHFDSAWSPPVDAYQKLEELGFYVEAMFYEPGMAFAGTYCEGCYDEVQLGGMSADDIERDYPGLDQTFGIAESIREYEAEMAEEEEELTEWIKEGVEARKEDA